MLLWQGVPTAAPVQTDTVKKYFNEDAHMQRMSDAANVAVTTSTMCVAGVDMLPLL